MPKRIELVFSLTEFDLVVGQVREYLLDVRAASKKLLPEHVNHEHIWLGYDTLVALYTSLMGYERFAVRRVRLTENEYAFLLHSMRTAIKDAQALTAENPTPSRYRRVATALEAFETIEKRKEYVEVTA